MLYLEDYLEMIEHLPQELKDRFTEIRELDLEVQNASDKIEERMKTFFRGAKKLRISDRDLEFEAIRKDFYKVLDNADEKANQTNELYNLVDRYLRKLDQELHKFKMELEADNAGITEVLEKRSLEMDANERNKEKKNSQKENRYQTANLSKSEKKSERKNSYEKAGSSVGYHYPTSSSGPSTPLPYNQLGHPGLGGNAIAAAASQAIAATQQMQQGRRTASLKASYDAVHLGLVQPTEFSSGGGVGGRELLVNEELHYAAQQALAATTSDRIGTGGGSAYEQKRNKRKSQHLYNPLEFMGASSVPPEEREELFAEIEEGSMELAPIASAVDPNEPRYCLCNDVSHGDMVGCDNEACPIEWFHYGCVGITTAPKGKWYCPQCSASMKRRGRKAADNR